MRTLVASALYVYLAAGIFAQQPDGPEAKDLAGRVAFFNRQVQLVESYRNAGDYQAAERVLRDWLAAEPAGSKSSLTVQNGLGDLMREEGRNAEARQVFNKIIDAPGVTPEQRLNALIGLADVDLHQGDWKTSIEEWNAALEIARRERDARSESAILRGLGRTWLNAGSAARAEPLLRRSLRIAEGNPAARLDMVASLSAMAEYYRAGNKLALAEDAWTRAIDIDRAAFGDNHPQVAYLMEMLAEVYSARGENTVARDYAARAEDMMRQWFGDGSPADATALANLALVEERAHTLGPAAGHYETALRVLRHSPELWPTVKQVMQRYAGVLKAMHRDREARAIDTEVKAFRPN